jgi:expansin (peptidoglycan-binding protein)
MLRSAALLGLVGCSLACGSSSGSGGTANVAGGGEEVAGGAQLGDVSKGEGTYYDADGSGNCSFDPSPGDLLVAALNDPQYGNAEWCGACAAVEGPKGKVTVRIVDRCPECKAGDLDLSPQAFDKIADRAQGRVAITWSFVSCATTGPVAYKFKDGSNPYWIALQVQNHRLPITKLEWKNGNDWVSLKRERYNFFTAAQAPGPFRVRVTALGGEVLEDELPAVEAEKVVNGQAQFP